MTIANGYFLVKMITSSSNYAFLLIILDLWPWNKILELIRGENINLSKD